MVNTTIIFLIPRTISDQLKGQFSATHTNNKYFKINHKEFQHTSWAKLWNSPWLARVYIETTDGTCSRKAGRTVFVTDRRRWAADWITLSGTCWRFFKNVIVIYSLHYFIFTVIFKWKIIPTCLFISGAMASSIVIIIAWNSSFCWSVRKLSR